MHTISLKTKGFTDIINITEKVQEVVTKSGKKEGVVHIFAVGSTVGLTTIETDSNLYEDFKEALEKFAPYKKKWRHEKTWGEDNGASHIRATLTGTSLTVPFKGGQLLNGQWQKIVFIDFDTRGRTREIVISIT
jgi:secondary thiamine-phosphate synthase enzyme